MGNPRNRRQQRQQDEEQGERLLPEGNAPDMANAIDAITRASTSHTQRIASANAKLQQAEADITNIANINQRSIPRTKQLVETYIAGCEEELNTAKIELEQIDDYIRNIEQYIEDYPRNAPAYQQDLRTFTTLRNKIVAQTHTFRDLQERFRTCIDNIDAHVDPDGAGNRAKVRDLIKNNTDFFTRADTLVKHIEKTAAVLSHSVSRAAELQALNRQCDKLFQDLNTFTNDNHRHISANEKQKANALKTRLLAIDNQVNPNEVINFSQQAKLCNHAEIQATMQNLAGAAVVPDELGGIEDAANIHGINTTARFGGNGQPEVRVTNMQFEVKTGIFKRETINIFTADSYKDANNGPDHYASRIYANPAQVKKLKTDNLLYTAAVMIENYLAARPANRENYPIVLRGNLPRPLFEALRTICDLKQISYTNNTRYHDVKVLSQKDLDKAQVSLQKAIKAHGSSTSDQHLAAIMNKNQHAQAEADLIRSYPANNPPPARRGGP